MLPIRWFFAMLLFALVVSGCGSAGSSPAQTLLGTWEQEGINHGMEYYPDGNFIERKPSGAVFAGTYLVSQDGTQVKLADAASALTAPVTFEGNDTMTLLGYRYKRSGTLPSDARAFGPPAKRLVGTWANSQMESFTYDFYPDGKYVTRNHGTALEINIYTISADGKAISIPRNDGSPLPVQVIGDKWLAFGNNTYRRIAATPSAAQPDPATLPTSAAQNADGFQPIQLPGSAPAATALPAATAAPTAALAAAGPQPGEADTASTTYNGITVTIAPKIVQYKSTATFRATGFQAGEAVGFLLHNAEQFNSEGDATLIADANGAVTHTVNLADGSHLALGFVSAIFAGRGSKRAGFLIFEMTDAKQAQLTAAQATAAAQPQAEPFTLTPNRVVNSKVRLLGQATGYANGEAVDIYILTPQGPYYATPFQTNALANGVQLLLDFSFAYHPALPGTWRVRLVGAKSGRVMEASFEVAPEAFLPMTAATITALQATPLATATVVPPATSAPTNDLGDAAPAGDCGGLEHLTPQESLRIAQANAAGILSGQTNSIKITQADAWKFKNWLVMTIVTNPISDPLPIVLRPQASGYTVAGFLPPVAPTPQDYEAAVPGVPSGVIPCWLVRNQQ